MTAPILRTTSLDLRPLYYFVQVAQAGSFSRAAATLSIAQPVLSRFIRRLEDDLQVQLLHRNGRGVRLTDAGLQRIESGRTVLHNLSQAETGVAALRDASLGSVSIGLLPLLGAELTFELVRRLRNEHPLISIALREGFAAETLEWLSAGMVDIGVLYNPPPVATLILDYVLEDRLHLVGAPKSLDLGSRASVAARMLADVPLVLAPQPHRLRALVDDMAHKAGIRLKVEADVTGICTILELVHAGIGFTVLPSMLVRGEARAGRLQSWPITEPEIAPKLFIATSMQRPQTKATKVVLKFIGEIFRGRKKR